MTVISEYTPMYLTSKGLNLEAKVKAGLTDLKLIKAVIGEGYLQEGTDLLSLERLVSEVPSHQTGVQAESATVDFDRQYVAGEGITMIGVRIVNGNMEFNLREIGIIAMDPDDGEILYAYVNFGDHIRNFMAYDGIARISQHYNFPFIMRNTENVQAVITYKGEVYFDDLVTEMDERKVEDTILNKKINSEKTARENADNGLSTRIDQERTTRSGEISELSQRISKEIVDRQSADDAKVDANGGDISETVTAFVEAKTRENIKSGESIKIILGKITKWFTDLKTVAWSGKYTDLTDVPTSLPASDVPSWAKQSSKPSYTASEVGAAEKDHTHSPTFSEASSRANITSGETLSTLFGKIKKFFTDLKPVAFSGSYSDLTGVPSSLKNPNSLSISKNGTTYSYDGAESKDVGSIYAPESAGTAGYTPVSNGSGAVLWRHPEYFAICNTKISTDKSETLIANPYNFKLLTGVRVNICFNYPIDGWHNEKNPIYLNVASTGAKPVLYGGFMPSGWGGSEPYRTHQNTWKTGEIVEFMYDGTNWVAQGTSKVFNPRCVVVAHALSAISSPDFMKSVDFLCHGDDDTEVIQEAINSCAENGTVILTSGVYRVSNLTIGKSITIKTNPSDRYAYNSGAYCQGEIALSGKIQIKRAIKFSGIHFSFSNPIDGALSFTGATIFNRRFVLDSCTLSVTNTTSSNAVGSKLISGASSVYAINTQFQFSVNNASYICYTGIDCEDIEIDKCVITLQNAANNTGADLNFLYKVSNGGVIRNSVLQSSSNSTHTGRINFVCENVSVINCDIQLNHINAKISHFTSASNKAMFVNNKVEFFGQTYLNFANISGNVFTNKCSTTAYNIQILSPAVISSNRFFGRLGLNCTSKVVFTDNMLEYTRHGTLLPSGSIEANNLVC